MALRIALDAMGGDHAPRAIIRGAVQALGDRDDVHIVLVGDEARIRAELDEAGSCPGTDRLCIVHASQTVQMDEPPLEALRRKKDSSLVKTAQLGADRAVEAIISAGNTGAFAAAAQLKMRPLPCVSRPGIAVAIPSFHGPVVLCDVGANIQSKPHHIYEYAVLASVYAEKVVGTKSPRVGLLSIGEENRKGTELVRQTHALLREDTKLRFVGNVEGRDLFSNVCDVAVCDGFVGNILLKLVEGLSEGLFATISREFEDEDHEARVRFDSALQRVWARHDYSEYGGAPLLGVNGVCVICHGRSEERAIRNAVRAAATFLSHSYNEAIVERLGDR